MQTILPIFNAFVRHQVGNGEQTKFWHDRWLGTPLKIQFPYLYHFVQIKHSSVAHSFQHSGWSLQHASLTQLGQTEKEELFLSLQQIQITHNEDVLIWLRNLHTFSVSSAYNFISNTPSPVSETRNIWSIRSPLRVSIFAWLLLNNRLTIVDNLVKRGWHLPNMCVMCRKNEESVTHLFQTCLLAKEIRLYITTAFNGQFYFPPRFTEAISTTLLTDPDENMASKQWELVTCFVIWRERCRRIFADTQMGVVPLIREIRTEFKS